MIPSTDNAFILRILLGLKCATVCVGCHRFYYRFDFMRCSDRESGYFSYLLDQFDVNGQCGVHAEEKDKKKYCELTISMALLILSIPDKSWV